MAHHDDSLRLHELLLFITRNLGVEGSFFLLLPAKRESEIRGLLTKENLVLQQIVYVQQTLKHQPFRLMIQGRRNKVEAVTEQTIAIKNDAGEYTEDFIALLKDYYLYL